MSDKKQTRHGPPVRDTISKRDPNSQRTATGRIKVREPVPGTGNARKIKGTLSAPWADVTRDRLRASHVLDKLVECAEGITEMTSVQARVALGLIDKVLPTLTENKNDNTGELIVNVYGRDGNDKSAK